MGRDLSFTAVSEVFCGLRGPYFKLGALVAGFAGQAQSPRVLLLQLGVCPCVARCGPATLDTGAVPISTVMFTGLR